MALIWKVSDVKSKVKNMMDLLVKQQYDSWDDLAKIDQDTLDGYKAIDETYSSLSEYLEEHATMMDEMTKKLDDIQQELKELKLTMELKEQA